MPLPKFIEFQVKHLCHYLHSSGISSHFTDIGPQDFLLRRKIPDGFWETFLIRVFGKGSKERVVYLNNACVDALNDYLKIRSSIAAVDRRALFLSSRRTRISRSTVHSLVKKHLLEAGLDSSKYSSHKLRHTAATLMLQNGVDVRTLQELLGHEHLNTTQIYTHVENSSLRDAAQRSPLSDIKPHEHGQLSDGSDDN